MSELRDQIERLVDQHWPLDPDIDGVAERKASLTDGLVAIVQPVLDAKTAVVHAQLVEQQVAQRIPEVMAQLDEQAAETRRLRTLVDEAERSLPIEQRRLLAISRMVFDQIAEGRPFTRDEAADLAQRIVDEIGHSVTDEPALGPSFRVEIEQLRTELASTQAERTNLVEQWGSLLHEKNEALERAEDYEQILTALRSVSEGRGVPSGWARPWRERAESAEAAIERVRAIRKAPGRSAVNLYANAQDDGWDQALDAVHAALDQATDEGSCAVGDHGQVPE